MRILLTFAGVRDPFNPDGIVDGQPSHGPVLSVLDERQFEAVYVFTDERLLENARDLIRVITGRAPLTKTHIIEISLPDPTDYEAIFYALSRECRVILGKHERDDPSYFISTASGTPQMQTVWFLLAQSGLLPATLLKVTPRRFLSSAEPVVSEIRLSIAEFPKITPADLDPLEFASLRIQKEKLEAEREASFSNIEAEGIVGKGKAIQDALRIAAKVAPTDYPVLILGETGTGKELIARLIHRWSARRAGPLISVNCGALPDTLIESELFGYALGAFTGATHPKKGRFELANGGTIFLDEVGDLPLNAQVKLLRVLQEGEIEKIGATKITRVDVRVVAATHQNLKQSIAEGRFREDLYYRLLGIPISVPPLRERREDIPLLVEHFLHRLSPRPDVQKKFSRRALKILLEHSWPGNVRELQNVLTNVVVLTEGSVVEDTDLPPEIRLGSKAIDGKRPPPTIPPGGLALPEYLLALEKAYFETAIEITKGNNAAAARLLGIDPPTFRKRAREKFGL